MSDTQFKKAFDDVSPDIYMETRILANIKEKRKKAFTIKAVLSGALALAVAVGCFGGIQYKKQNMYVDRPFSVMVVDASEDVPITTELGDTDVVIPNLQIVNEEDGTLSAESDVGFYVTGDDVDFVQYQSNTGNFYGYDIQKDLYDKQNRNYYTAVIPVPDDEAQEMVKYIYNQKMNPETAGIKYYAQTHDLSEYFSGEDVDFNDYWVYFEKCSDMVGYENEDGYAFFVVDAEKAGLYYYNTQLNETGDLTIKYYDLHESTLNLCGDDYLAEMNNIGYSPDAAFEALDNNPDMDKSELPGDEITIIVTFKDGKKAKKVIGVSFDKDGYAQFASK